jgi:hypothetical protein
VPRTREHWIWLRALALGLLAALAPAQSDSEDVVARAQAWHARAARPTIALSADDVAAAERYLDDLRMVQVVRPEQRSAVFALLLDLASLDPGDGPKTNLQTPELRARIGREAFQSLGRALDLSRDGSTQRWLVRAVLAETSRDGRARRLKALECLERRYESETLSALLYCAEDAALDVRERAVRALIGWPDDGVHLFLLVQLARERRSGGWLPPALIREHFQALGDLGSGRAGPALVAFVQPELVSSDWRAAVRSLPLLLRLDDTLAVPPLIESLGLWVARREAGGGSKRVEGELVAELRRRSGRNIGPYPERWSLWWRAKSSGSLASEVGQAEAPSSKASFYGLRPTTDRVTFLIDRSGSMGASVGENLTRYGQALDQLAAFLRELGPAARFRLVLFDSEPRVWKDGLALATPANIEAAQRWAGYQRPDGGTHLKLGVEACLRVDLNGKIDPSKLEEDTVIVLCDGETAEGAGWVRPFWWQSGEATCIRFYCVQLGGGGNGTLEALADVSGGEFVRVN